MDKLCMAMYISGSSRQSKFGKRAQEDDLLDPIDADIPVVDNDVCSQQCMQHTIGQYDIEN
jgi:hypothetical protein